MWFWVLSSESQVEKDNSLQSRSVQLKNTSSANVLSSLFSMTSFRNATPTNKNLKLNPLIELIHNPFPNTGLGAGSKTVMNHRRIAV